MSALEQSVTERVKNDPVYEFTMEGGTDITGWELSFFLAPTAGAANVSGFPKTVGSGITITDGPNGVFQVAYSTDTLSGLYVWNVDRTDTTVRDTIASGKLKVKPTANPTP